MQRLRIDAGAIERRKQIVGIESSDLAPIAAIRGIVVRKLDEHIAIFFEHLVALDATAALFQSASLHAMLAGDCDAKYEEQRIELGLMHANAGFDVRVFIGAFRRLLANMGADVMREYEHAASLGFEHVMSVENVACFDISLTVVVMASGRERLIRHQQEAIRSSRTKMLAMDITGVPTIDSIGASHILQTVTAARLTGTQVIVTGGSADVAQSLIALGIEVRRLTTVGELPCGSERTGQSLGDQVYRPRLVS